MIRFTLRIPDELHKKIVSLADQYERSMNAQVLYMLKTWEDHGPAENSKKPKIRE